MSLDLSMIHIFFLWLGSKQKDVSKSIPSDQDANELIGKEKHSF